MKYQFRQSDFNLLYALIHLEVLPFNAEMSLHFTGSVHTKVIDKNCFDWFLQQSDSTGKWEKTVLEIDTRERNRLPIMDVSAYDIGGKDQDFKLEIGPACFHHTVLSRTA